MDVEQSGEKHRICQFNLFDLSPVNSLTQIDCKILFTIPNIKSEPKMMEQINFCEDGFEDSCEVRVTCCNCHRILTHIMGEKSRDYYKENVIKYFCDICYKKGFYPEYSDSVDPCPICKKDTSWDYLTLKPPIFGPAIFCGKESCGLCFHQSCLGWSNSDFERLSQTKWRCSICEKKTIQQPENIKKRRKMNFGGRVWSIFDNPQKECFQKKSEIYVKERQVNKELCLYLLKDHYSKTHSGMYVNEVEETIERMIQKQELELDWTKKSYCGKIKKTMEELFKDGIITKDVITSQNQSRVLYTFVDSPESSEILCKLKIEKFVSPLSQFKQNLKRKREESHRCSIDWEENQILSLLKKRKFLHYEFAETNFVELS